MKSYIALVSSFSSMGLIYYLVLARDKLRSCSDGTCSTLIRGNQSRGSPIMFAMASGGKGEREESVSHAPIMSKLDGVNATNDTESTLSGPGANNMATKSSSSEFPHLIEKKPYKPTGAKPPPPLSAAYEKGAARTSGLITLTAPP